MVIEWDWTKENKDLWGFHGYLKHHGGVEVKNKNSYLTCWSQVENNTFCHVEVYKSFSTRMWRYAADVERGKSNKTILIGTHGRCRLYRLGKNNMDMAQVVVAGNASTRLFLKIVAKCRHRMCRKSLGRLGWMVDVLSQPCFSIVFSGRPKSSFSHLFPPVTMKQTCAKEIGQHSFESPFVFHISNIFHHFWQPTTTFCCLNPVCWWFNGWTGLNPPIVLVVRRIFHIILWWHGQRLKSCIVQFQYHLCE